MCVLLSTERPLAEVRADVGGIALLFLVVRARGIPLRESRMLQVLRNSPEDEILLVSVCVALQYFDEGLYWQVIRVLNDGDEDTEVVHRFDLLANHADTLRACVEVDALFSLFPFEGSKIVVPGTTGSPDSQNF